MTRAATRADVARLAGTSEAVVSYVMNDGPRGVAPETRRRVLDAIAKVGYRPNVAARALASGSSGAWGLVVPDISNQFFAALAHRLQNAVIGTRRVILLGDASDDKEAETQLLNAFAARQVDGLLVVGTDGAPDLSAATSRGIPVVVLDRAVPGTRASSVAIDNVAAGRVATTHLLEHGYDSVGIIAGPFGVTTADDRFAGWSAALDAGGLRIHRQWHFHTGFTRAGGWAAGKALLASDNTPRAVLASNEQQAIGLLAYLSRSGVRVPEDVALLAIDGTADAEYANPPLSTIVQPLDDIVRVALELLDHPGDAPTHRVVDFALALRQSCGVHNETTPTAPAPTSLESITDDNRNQVIA